MIIASLGLTAMAMMAVPGKSKAQSAELKAAIKFTDNEQFEKGTNAFKAMVAKDAANAEAWYYFGENLLASEKVDSAEVLYKKGLEANAKNPLNHIGLAKAYRAKGKMSDAQSAIDAAFALFTDKSAKVKDELKTRVYVEAAEAMLEGAPKQTAKAIEYADKALAIDEASVAALIVKAEAMFEADPLSATEPLNLYKKAIELDKTSAKAQAGAAYMYYRARQHKNAIDYYTNAIKTDANFAPAYIGRADAYYYNNQPNEAIADAKKYLELNAGNITAYKRYIGFLIAAKRYDEALTEIGKLEKRIGAKDPILNRLKGYTTYEKADYKTALESMLFFINNYENKDKINTTDYEYLGRAYGQTGDDSLKYHYYEKAVRMDYKNKQALVTEAIAYYKDKKNYVKQAYWYELKIKLGSKDINDCFYLGRAAYYAGLYEKSDSAWTCYLGTMGHVPDGYFGCAKAKQGIDPKNEQWLAKDCYLSAISKVKFPDEQEKYKRDLDMAYYYLGNYYSIAEKDYGKAKCYYNKQVALATGSDISAQAAKFLESKDIKAATEVCE